MSVIEIAYILTGTIYCIFGLIFIVSSIIEKKYRAAVIAATLILLFILAMVGGALIINNDMLIIPMLAIVLLTALFFVPSGKMTPIMISESNEKVDERDIMFAREEYFPGDSKYETYYSQKPEYNKIDDKIRSMPVLLGPGGRYYDHDGSTEILSIFKTIHSLIESVDGEISKDRKSVEPDQISASIKQNLRTLGADDAGIAALNPNYIYSHVGRGPEPWGSPITLNHSYAIMFAIEMDYDKVESAPKLPITNETAKKYLQCATISIEIARYIRSLGYSARAHISGSNYQIMLPPVAFDAGLGELGRMGYLISPRFGPRIRLGAITTDMPLAVNKPIAFGVQDFCEKCLKCAVNCPSGAISSSGKETLRGVNKWPLNIEKCMLYWRAIGTDCGLCMKVCPYSHPPTFIHNIVRSANSRSAIAQWVSIFADDLFYGHKAKY